MDAEMLMKYDKKKQMDDQKQFRMVFVVCVAEYLMEYVKDYIKQFGIIIQVFDGK